MEATEEMKCDHLDIVKESYGVHLFFTVQLSFVLFLLSVISVIHGLCPWIFIGTVSNKIKHLNGVLSER